MGFERVTAIIQGTKNLTDFSGTVSNYETDIFRPIFDELEKLSGKKYGSTIPIVGQAHRLPDTEAGSRSGRPTNRIQNRKRSTSLSRHRRSHPGALVRDCRRNHSIKRRTRLRFATHSSARCSLRAHARFSRTILLQACRCGGEDDGRRFPRSPCETKDNQRNNSSRRRSF